MSTQLITNNDRI